MPVHLNGKSKRVRQWWKTHIFRVIYFRTMFEYEKNATTSRVRHAQKKVEQHIQYGICLGIPESEIIELQREIVQEVKKGNDAKTIIKTLLIRNGQK